MFEGWKTTSNNSDIANRFPNKLINELNKSLTFRTWCWGLKRPHHLLPPHLLFFGSNGSLIFLELKQSNVRLNSDPANNNKKNNNTIRQCLEFSKSRQWKLKHYATIVIAAVILQSNYWNLGFLVRTSPELIRHLKSLKYETKYYQIHWICESACSKSKINYYRFLRYIFPLRDFLQS